MLVKELKQKIENKKNDELIKLIVEVYKVIPKRIKEDYNIDKIICEGVSVKKQDEIKDIETLETEIKHFIECARAQYYLAPNRIIPKNERSKWRFKVKKYIKDLKVSNSPIATKLLIDLYNLLSYGCHYWIFSSDDPFRSVGIVQSDLLDYIFKSKLQEGVTKENIKICIDVLINSEVDRNTVHSELIDVFIDNLTLNETKEIAIELLKNELLLLGKKPPKNNSYTFHGKDYETQEKINNICETILKLYIKLCDYDSGIDYYIQNYIERDKKVMYYCLLEILRMNDLIEKWMEVYEKASSKMELRESLQKEYKYIKINNSFSS